MGGRGDEPVRGTSALTVEGDLPGSLAISLHGVLRSGILWTVSRSCSVGRPIRPSGYRILRGLAAWELIAIPHPGPSEAI